MACRVGSLAVVLICSFVVMLIIIPVPFEEIPSEVFLHLYVASSIGSATVHGLPDSCGGTGSGECQNSADD